MARAGRGDEDVAGVGVSGVAVDDEVLVGGARVHADAGGDRRTGGVGDVGFEEGLDAGVVVGLRRAVDGVGVGGRAGGVEGELETVAAGGADGEAVVDVRAVERDGPDGERAEGEAFGTGRADPAESLAGDGEGRMHGCVWRMNGIRQGGTLPPAPSLREGEPDLRHPGAGGEDEAVGLVGGAGGLYADGRGASACQSRIGSSSCRSALVGAGEAGVGGDAALGEEEAGGGVVEGDEIVGDVELWMLGSDGGRGQGLHGRGRAAWPTRPRR